MSAKSLERLIEKLWLPGREKLARHVPSLNRLDGKIGWLACMYLGPWVSASLIWLLEKTRPDWYPAIQALLIGGAFLLVDVIGIRGRPRIQRRYGENAYDIAFRFLFIPGLMFLFLPGVIHVAIVPGQRLLPPVPAMILAGPFLITGSLIALKVYFQFGIDRLIYMYMYYPEEGTMMEDEIYSHIRHPQYASFFYLILGFMLVNGTLESLVLIQFIAVFGIFRIVPEEIELGRRFGEEYKRYRKSTPAFFPRLSRGPAFIRYLLRLPGGMTEGR